MRLVRKLDLPEMKFSLYFLGNLGEEEAGNVPGNDAKRLTFTFGREAMLELTHNWGTEDEPEFSYHDGNAEPQGPSARHISEPTRLTRIAYAGVC